MRLSTLMTGIAAACSASLLAGSALAQQALEIIGQPVDGAMGFQPSGTEGARDLVWLDTMILYIITVIVVFVTALLIYVMIRYNSKSNPTPARFTHNSPLEVAWTVIPIVILVFIGAFSLPVLFKDQEIPVGDVTIKATGYQWYWGYEYVDEDVAFDSYMIGSPALGGNNMLTPEVEADLAAAGYSRDQFLLATDTAVVVPVGKDIVIQVTAADVIHSWKIPAFGVMQDAVPGRLAALWFKAEKEGIYFGQCSELCGQMHAYMPITVKVVSEAAYAEWLEKAKAGDVELSHAVAETPVQVASND
ncbi:cytochrome c oxidase subunit II [Tabrizicola sp.]|uniref:cytochrome c oxidase subunit II n=1 Tax=Tabrizicola sp. TaxID=2005166 RepID=UPI00260CE42E|nr:cytochrome c oxidase subunit II [Tabrizicola sp.]MDM7931977.1 cytochrome c oxidase subunit II [Tabrizicola sp.]